MNSPLPPHPPMEKLNVPELPTAMRCPGSGGLWVRPDAFWAWRARQPEGSLSEAEPADAAPAEDSPAGKRCPEDGAFLIPHRVGHGLDLHVDRCGRCGGMWFDGGEWEALRGAGLLDRLHLVFTSAWQARIRRQRKLEQEEAHAEAAFGPELTPRLREVREWLRHHPLRAEMAAYLHAGED